MATDLRIRIEETTRLAALKGKTGADNYTEVLTNALKLYEALIERHEAGHPLYERTDSGDYVVFKMFFEQVDDPDPT